MHTMPDEFHARFQYVLRRHGVSVNNTGVELGRRGYTTPFDSAYHAGQASPHGIVGPTEVGHVRYRFLAMWGRDNATWHGLIKRPVFDVDNQMNHDLARCRSNKVRTVV